MNLYFDHAAAVPVAPETLDRFRDLFLKYPANQEASGAHARSASEALSAAEKSVLRVLTGNVRTPFRVLWTNNGTESIRAAVRIAALRFPGGGRVLYSAGEHAAVRAAVRELPEIYEKMELPLDSHGLLDLSALSRTADADTVLLILHSVQPETGAVQNLAEVRSILSSRAPRALFFCDAVQSIGKLDFDFSGANPDMISLSGQKLGCPSGGALLMRDCLYPFAVVLRNTLHAVGRLPAPFGILISERLESLLASRAETEQAVRRTKQKLLTLLEEAAHGKFRTTLGPEEGSPFLLHLLLRGYQGAIVVRALSARGVSVASGSACDAETKNPSHVLRAMGIARDDAFGAFRISFSEPVPDEDLAAFARLFRETLENY